jgi:adenosylmethionine-8-amino-7-oxononanoate aminotransferase
MALRLARGYHAERGESRWRIISPAHAYHGATFGTLALSGPTFSPSPIRALPRASPSHSSEHGPARRDGRGALAALDRALEEAGPDTVAAFVCEPVSAAAMPGYSPPIHFLGGGRGAARKSTGSSSSSTKVVTGFGRTGSWFAYQQLSLQPDVISFGKAAAPGMRRLLGSWRQRHVYEAVASGSREFEHGHTWDGAPQLCALVSPFSSAAVEGLVERVRSRGPEPPR